MCFYFIQLSLLSLLISWPTSNSDESSVVDNAEDEDTSELQREWTAGTGASRREQLPARHLAMTAPPIITPFRVNSSPPPTLYIPTSARSVRPSAELPVLYLIIF